MGVLGAGGVLMSKVPLYLGAGRDGEKVIIVPERDHVRRVRRQPADIGI